MNEHQWIEFVRTNLHLEQYQCFQDQGANNTFSCPNSDQRFQFGDLRIETPIRTIVLEFDCGGGVTNFLKYWPYLSGITNDQPTKPFVLIHVFDPIYPSHIQLWRYCHSLLPRLVVDATFVLFGQQEFQPQDVLQEIQRHLGAGDQIINADA